MYQQKILFTLDSEDSSTLRIFLMSAVKLDNVFTGTWSNPKNMRSAYTLIKKVLKKELKLDDNFTIKERKISVQELVEIIDSVL